MNKTIFAGLALLFSGSVFAATDHYFLRDDTHVHHLKITTIGDETNVSMDVDFEPNAAEAGREPCSAVIAGEAKKTGENEWVMKKQITGEARYCSLTIQLTATGAKVQQSPDCNYFAGGICHFDSDGKELVKIK